MLTHREINLIAEEIQAKVLDGAVQKIFEATNYGTVLRIRKPGETLFLLLSASPKFGRLHLLPAKPANVRDAGPFLMLLRKHLGGGRIRSIEVSPNDRIVSLFFDDKTLILELIGRHSNLIVCDGEGQILGALHHGERIKKGATYAAPPALGSDSGPDRWNLGSLPLGERSPRLTAEYEVIETDNSADSVRKELDRQIRRALKRTRRLVRKIEVDLERAAGADESRVFGELLQSAYGKVERGASSAFVPNFYDEELRPVEVPLDPAVSLQVNIDRYFHEYRRMKDASGRIEERLLTNMQRQSDLEAFLKELETQADEDLPGLERRVQKSKLVRAKQASAKQAQKSTVRPYREFLSPSGKPIFVGRSSKHNDALTTRVAKGRDVWLHARDWAGSHVLIRLNRGEQASSEDLLQAALLAAHFSKGKNDTMVDVTYTEAKHVRKPKGAPAGMVTIAGGSNLAIRLDPARLQVALDTEVH